MKRVIFIPIAIIILATLACSIARPSTPTTNAPENAATVEQQVDVTAEVIPATEIPIEPTEAIEPTATIEQPTATTAPTATEAPTATPAGPFEFVDTFDRNTGMWSEDMILTTQTSGRDPNSKSLVIDGMLSYKFEDKETYIYKYFTEPMPGNVSIEADYQAMGHINNGIALVCRVNEERTTWYEVRVSSTSDYAFYLFDKRRKTEEGKNPYLQLGKGKLKIDELYPTKPNTIKLTCLDNELNLDANKGKRTINQAIETQLEGSAVGIGVMSYDVVPIKINFEQIAIREER